MTPPRTSSWIVFLAGAAIIAIALFQTVTHGAPDQYTIGALLALALGGGVGRAVDGAVRAYVAAQVAAHTPAPPDAPSSNGAGDDAPS